MEIEKVVTHFPIQIIQNIDIIRLAGNIYNSPAVHMRIYLNSIMLIMYLYFVLQSQQSMWISSENNIKIYSFGKYYEVLTCFHIQKHQYKHHNNLDLCSQLQKIPMLYMKVMVTKLAKCCTAV